MLDQIQALRWFCDRQAFDQSTTDAGNEMPASRRSNSRMVRPSVIVALALVLLGVLFTAKDVRLPILRNSLVYARTVQNLELHHLALWEVCSDPAQVHSQGCGFSVLALPFTRMTGLNVGLKLASCFATALFILAMIAFFQRFNASFNLREEDLPLELVVACFNPLVIVQFWSAYSDSAFGASFLVSFVLLDKLLKDRVSKVATALAYTLTVMLAVFTRPAGLVLYPLHLLYGLWHRRQIVEIARRDSRRFFLLVASAALLAAWVGLGKLGHNPLLNINKGEYDIPVAYLSSVNGMIALLVLTFGVLLVVAAPRIAVTRESAPLFAVLAAYMHIFMVFHASIFNLRFFIPVFPLMALVIVSALRSVKRKRLVAACVATYALMNGATIFAFNDTVAYRFFTRISTHRINWGEFGRFDNLRIGVHVRMQEALDRLNAEVPRGGSLQYVTPYYEGVAQGIYQGSGLLRPDIQIHYAKRLEDLGPLPEDAWIFLPEKISRHPADPPGSSSPWLIHGSTRLSNLQQ